MMWFRIVRRDCARFLRGHSGLSGDSPGRLVQCYSGIGGPRVSEFSDCKLDGLGSRLFTRALPPIPLPPLRSIPLLAGVVSVEVVNAFSSPADNTVWGCLIPWLSGRGKRRDQVVVM